MTTSFASPRLGDEESLSCVNGESRRLNELATRIDDVRGSWSGSRACRGREACAPPMRKAQSTARSAVSDWAAVRNARADARLKKALPSIFPPPVLVHAY